MLKHWVQRDYMDDAKTHPQVHSALGWFWPNRSWSSGLRLAAKCLMESSPTWIIFQQPLICHVYVSFKVNYIIFSVLYMHDYVCTCLLYYAFYMYIIVYHCIKMYIQLLSLHAGPPVKHCPILSTSHPWCWYKVTLPQFILWVLEHSDGKKRKKIEMDHRKRWFTGSQHCDFPE